MRDYNFGEYHPTARPELYNQTISTRRWRLTRYPSCPHWTELFDLNDDPHEHFNLFNEPGYDEIVNELFRMLDQAFPAQPEVDNIALCKW